MSQKHRAPITKPKKYEKKDAKKDPIIEEPVDDENQPWKNIFRPTCAQPPKDNSFTLEDESAAAAVEGVLSAFTVSDPNDEGNPLCYVSAGFLSMTGYSDNECLGRNCKFLQAGKLDAATQESLRSCLSERRFATIEVTNYRKDGRPFQNLLSLAPVLGGDGSSLLHIVGVQCDVDERRRRGEVVDEAFVARWQEQVKHCLSAFAVVDVSGGGGAAGSSSSSGTGTSAGNSVGSTPGNGTSRGNTAQSQPSAAVCAVSPGFTSLTGYTQSDVMGWNLLCLCGPDSSERDMRKLITGQWSHTPTAAKLLCYKRDGTPFWGLVLSYPLTSISISSGAPATATTSSAMGSGAGGPYALVQSGAVAGARASGAIATSARQNQAQGGGQGGAAGRPAGLGLGLLGGGLLGTVTSGGGTIGLLGGLSAGVAALSHGGVGGAGGSSGGAPAGVSTIKYCLCCVIDITAQRLKKVVGGKYVLGKMIGAGAFGLVRIGKNTTTDELVAVKGVDATRFRSIAEIEQIQEEMSVLSSLKHPNIIRLYDVHFQSNTFFLVMEFAGNGSLVHYMRNHGDPVRRCLDETTAARVFVQMVSALDYCHRRRVVHRDLKPENILMDEQNNLKIADFGLAAVAAPFSGGLTLQCGTPEFTAPEITIGREYDGSSVDIWSMGVILYEMLSGSLPFKGANQAALFKAIQRGVFDPLPANVSSECKDLVRRMLVVDPKERITMDEILRHPWITKAIAASNAANGGGRLQVGGGLLPSQSMIEPAAASAAVSASPESRPSLQCSTSGEVGGGPGGSSGGGVIPGEASRPGSSSWRGGALGGAGSDSRGLAALRIGDGASTAGAPGVSRPPTSGSPTGPAGVTGGGLGAGQGQGLSSPVSPQVPGPGMGAPGNGDGPPGALHDSVKLIIPSQADRDDPILAAILRSHPHVSADPTAQPQSSPSRGGGADDGEDGEPLHMQPSAASYAMAGASGGVGRGRDGSGAASGRVGASRSMGGMPTSAGSGLHGQNQSQAQQGNGKARGGALLPTLGGGGSGPNTGNGVLDRRLQDPIRFRSPARGGPGTAGSAQGVRPNVAVPGSRAQQASSAGAPPSPGQSPHAHLAADSVGRQLPPIQTSRGPGKKSNWMQGS